MSNKTLAAALAAVVLVPLLVFVDVPAAEAHEQTKTVERCAYDPFAGNQCWNETVNVAHTHRVIPDNPPPDTTPKPKTCPSGTTGTPPNCLPVPPDNTNHVPPTTAPPTTAPPTTQPPPECPPGTVGAWPNCKTPPPPQCPPGTAGTWPDCKTPPPTTQPPPTTTTTTTVPAGCPKLMGTHPHLDRDQHRHSLGKNRNGRSMSGCHEASVAHCPSGQHEHAHGSLECHTLGSPAKNASGTHSGWTDHCHDGYHSHEHAGSCHAADPPYYEGVEITKTEIAYGYICITTNTKPHGDVKSCTRIPDDSDLKKRVDEALEDAGVAGAGLLVCVAASSAGGVPGLVCGGLWIAGTIVGEVLCLKPWCTKDNPPPVVGTNQRTSPADDQNEDSDNPPAPTTTPPTDDDVAEAEEKWRRGEIDGDELTRIQNARDCAKGYPWGQNCP